MCGIIGYVGSRQAMPILLNGLKRMEYRGYDSAGISIIKDHELHCLKRSGKINGFEKALQKHPFDGTTGIAHTRWATHGAPSVINAHPHSDCKGRLSLVHNGIIENYQALKKELSDQGHLFKTETDTEVLVHLIEEFWDKNTSLEEAIRLALSQVKGTYGIALISTENPDVIYVARSGSPLVLGISQGENFVASDVAALISHTKEVTYLDDGEMAVLSADAIQVKTITDKPVSKKVEKIGFDLEKIEKSGYDHFMLKEIMEQPKTIADTMRGRLLENEGTAKLGGIEHDFESLLYARRLLLTACGTSWHAALLGEYMLEEYLRIPTEVEYASEFRYRNPILDRDTVVIVLSQSGETADTLAAIREAKKRGAKVYGVCNVVGSSIARATDAGVYLHVGPEIGVASTKAFTSQVAVLGLITLFLARKKSMPQKQGKRIVEEMKKLPEKIARILEHNSLIREIAEEYQKKTNFLYLGRGYNFPVALEGALKLKEISYVHAEGYPAAEMKHGPIALIDENMPVVFIAMQDSSYDKIISNIQEVRARKGCVIAIATEGDENINQHADHVVYVPEAPECLEPILTSIPLQLLAYHIAVLRGCDVDQPRNLAKSVTVE
ncbi:glutamine--fructose-6-phosphate transaminase (isomerizing) [candidate division KSB1 bacterium]|nr:glutamine--fructose-6-phosphate transaminase (isomerizing) [candidate division KSB1 bacterium]